MNNAELVTRSPELRDKVAQFIPVIALDNSIAIDLTLDTMNPPGVIHVGYQPSESVGHTHSFDIRYVEPIDVVSVDEDQATITIVDKLSKHGVDSLSENEVSFLFAPKKEPTHALQIMCSIDSTTSAVDFYDRSIGRMISGDFVETYLDQELSKPEYGKFPIPVLGIDHNRDDFDAQLIADSGLLTLEKLSEIMSALNRVSGQKKPVL